MNGGEPHSDLNIVPFMNVPWTITTRDLKTNLTNIFDWSYLTNQAIINLGKIYCFLSCVQFFETVHTAGQTSTDFTGIQPPSFSSDATTKLPINAWSLQKWKFIEYHKFSLKYCGPLTSHIVNIFTSTP